MLGEAIAMLANTTPSGCGPLVLDVHLAPVPVLVVDSMGRVAAANRAAAALLGRHSSELVGAPVASILSTAPTDTSGVVPVPRPDGAALYVRQAIQIVGATTFIFLTDMTVAEDARQALIRANVDLEQFAHVASHDLQEPLRALGGYVQEIDKRYRDKADAAGHFAFDRVAASVERLRRVIRDMLQFSKSTRGDANERTDLSSAFDEAVTALTVAIDRGGAAVQLALTEPVILRFNRTQLVSVLQNLLGNAIKFRRTDVAPIVVVSGYVTRDGTAIVSVEDNGVGIPVEGREHLFGVFQRLHGTAFPGSGIGLSGVKRAVERAGGSIRHEDVTGGGSRFVFTAKVAR